MYNHAYSYNVNPQNRRFCSDAQGTPITELPTFYFGERPVFTMTFPDNVLTEGEKLVFVMDNENRFLDSHSITGLEPVMAWCIHEITAEDVENKSIELELYCFSQKYADVINGHDNAVTCTLSLFIKSLDENLNCTFSTLATTLAYAEPTIVSPDCVFNDLPIDMYLTRDEMNALIAEVEALQREAIEKAEQAQQSAQEAKEAADSVKGLEPLILNAPPTTATVGNKIGKLALWHDDNEPDENKANHVYHLVYITTSENATLYHWEECVLESQRNVANGFAGLDGDGLVNPNTLPIAHFIQSYEKGAIACKQNSVFGIRIDNGEVVPLGCPAARIDSRGTGAIAPANLDYAVRSVLPNVTEIPAATSDYSLVDSSATTLNHSHTFSHVPNSAPTYRLPSVSDTTISHYIELTVDFTNVQTYSFLDSNGDALVPLFTPAIAAGDVYTFKMEYSAIKAKWLIYPQKQGAVADDFVMRGEVGAANGVAGLDSNGLVLREQLPRANGSGAGAVSNSYGVVRVIGDYGIDRNNINGYLFITKATNTYISGRIHSYAPIVPANLNYAVTAALTDSKKISLTDEQKAAAQEVFGIGGPITEIPAATSEYTLSEGIFKHAPTNAPTYNLPAITDTIRSHVIVLAIDFSSVQTFSFVPPQDSGVTFQSYANPNQGDVWVFRCVWYGGKWRICPMKIKNCVTRQLTSGALSITDAVRGNALALKMTAPISVVMNQLVQNGNFADSFSSWTSLNVSTSVANNVCTVSYNTETQYKRITHNVALIAGHVYARYCEFISSGLEEYAMFGGNGFSSVKADASATTSWKSYFSKDTSSHTTTVSLHFSLCNEVINTAYSTQIRNIQLVDLTQYFNGDSTLIDSITSWDDLVAYDPRFASYVEYNTGTVTGVQPTVKVTGKNLFDLDKFFQLENNSYITKGTNNEIILTGYGCFSGIKLKDMIPALRVGQTITTSAVVSFVSGTTSTVANIQIRTAGGVGVVSLTNEYPSTPSVGITKSISRSVTVTQNMLDNYIWFYGAQGTVDVRVTDLQIELGETATSYEPYHDGGTATAPIELFAVGNAADEYEAVAGTLAQTLKQVDLSTLTWTAGDGTYSATITDIKPSTLNFLLPNGYVGSVSGTTLTITASATPTGTMVYEKATKSTTDVTLVQIDLQSGNNTAMQTDGGRLADIDVTYESNEI